MFLEVLFLKYNLTNNLMPLVGFEKLTKLFHKSAKLSCELNSLSSFHHLVPFHGYLLLILISKVFNDFGKSVLKLFNDKSFENSTVLLKYLFK
jgi:hypothetical protein